MKQIIDINEIAYKNATHIPSIDWNGNLLRIVNDALQNGTPIPDNATNGDVIKALFEPNINKRHNGEDIEAYYFDTVWWNAPYQKGGKE